MYKLRIGGWRFDEGLQLVQADVRMDIDGTCLVDEPLCVDVGLPALLLSAFRDVTPDRWSDTRVLARMPFFCCGCGDPDCRAYSFDVRHEDGGRVVLTELEERLGLAPRKLGEYEIPLDEYRRECLRVGRDFLQFIDRFDYRPLHGDPLPVIRRLVSDLERWQREATSEVGDGRSVGDKRPESEERFDVFDENRRHTGTATRREVHRQGLWHQTFHCWIWTVADGEPALLLQRRHADKDTFPNLLDISCAGHLLAGEQPEDGVRELEEELGLNAFAADLVPIGVYAEADEIAADVIDREFCHLYIYRCDRALEEYLLQPEEVTGLFRVTLRELRSILDGNAVKLAGVALSAREALGGAGGDVALSEGMADADDGVLHPCVIEVSAEDLVPHPRDYFDRVMAAVEAANAG